MRKLLLLVALCGLCFGQSRRGTFTVEYKKALSSSTQVITVALPSGSARTVRFDSAYLESTAACEFTLERDGTAATATALTVNAVNTGTSNAALAYRDSDAGAGTVLSRFTVQANGSIAIDLAQKGLKAGENLTLRSASCTATVITALQWGEY